MWGRVFKMWFGLYLAEPNDKPTGRSSAPAQRSAGPPMQLPTITGAVKGAALMVVLLVMAVMAFSLMSSTMSTVSDRARSGAATTSEQPVSDTVAPR